MKLVTLTLNPAFDIHLNIPDFKEGKESLVNSFTRDIGGKGINISRALLAGGIQNRAVVALGDENASDFLRLMNDCRISDYSVITVKGYIRENMTIHAESGVETRISYKGFSTGEELFDEAYSLIDPDSDAVLTFTGSVPEGITQEQTEAFLNRIKLSGARLVIDSKSVPLEMLKRIKPWLIKPNAEELYTYFGKLDFEKVVSVAVSLHKCGIANALISLGADGAVLAADDGVFTAHIPHIDAVSTVGAGDSMIAGFLAAYNKSSETRLLTASAYGTAACLTNGTNPPNADDILRLMKEIEIMRVRKLP